MTTKHVLLILMGLGLFLSCQDDLEKSEKNENSVINKAVFSGYVQKGPFINGSSVTISELDEYLDQTGKTYFTTISNNQGSFEKKNIELASNYVSLKADGYYFNEVSGKTSTGQITLYALVDVEDVNSANVNVLTHLERARVEYLVQEESLSFAEAKKQAQKEVIAIFGISEPTAFELLDLTSDATLLAVSCILQGSHSSGEMAELMADIITDIRTDGVIDNTLKLKLIDNAIAIPLSDIRDNMASKYAELGINVSIPDFESCVKSFITGNMDPNARITYPATGLYGVNILSDEVTSVTRLAWDKENVSPYYSMNADVPRGMSLRIVVRNVRHEDSVGAWASSCDIFYLEPDKYNWQINYIDNEYTIPEFALKGKQSDLKIGFTVDKVGTYKYDDNDLITYIMIEYYENGSITPTKTKKLYIGNPEIRNEWTNKVEDLYVHNEKKVTVGEGIYGTLIQAEGNCMPGVDWENTTCKNYPVKRKIMIYERTKYDQVEQKDWVFYTEIKTKFIAAVESNDEGFYEIKLSPGKYSVFIEEKGLLYGRTFDSEGYISSVEVESGKSIKHNLMIDYASY